MFRRTAGPLFLLMILLLQLPARPVEAQDFRIRGTVRDARSGLPVPRAEVSIVSVDAGGEIVATVADPDGRFLFANLSPGKYILSARHRGYAAQNFEQHESFSTAIAVGKDLDTENLEFLLVPAALIAGQVTNEFGDPVRDAQVMLFREGIADGKHSIHRQNQVGTDDQGRYRFSGLPGGRYYLAVSAEPWYARHPQPPRVATGAGFIGSSLSPIQERNTALDVTYPVTYYSGATDSSRASAIALQPGEAEVADFSLQPVPALRMRFTAPGTDLSRGFQLVFSQRIFDDQTPARALSSFDKDFIDVSNVPVGLFTVNLRSVANGRTVSVAQQEVQAGQAAEINLNQTAAQTSVSGTVQTSAGIKLPQPAAINLRDTRTGTTFNAPISPDGNFGGNFDFSSFPVKPGTYLLSLNGGDGFFVRRVQSTGANSGANTGANTATKVSGRNIEIQGPEPVRLSVDLSFGLGSVSGIALLDGKPAAGAMILLVPRETSPSIAPNPSLDISPDTSPDKLHDVSLDTLLAHRDQSDSDGTFTLAGVAPGQYILMAIADGWDQEWGSPSVLKRWISGGQVVQVAPNRESSVKVLVQ